MNRYISDKHVHHSPGKGSPATQSPSPQLGAIKIKKPVYQYAGKQYSTVERPGVGLKEELK